MIKLSEVREIQVGKLGKIEFKKGYYVYTGSALNSLEARINRHLSKKKKLFWHIDYLLKYATIINVYYKISNYREECEFADILAADFEAIKNFGSTDCKCKSHLFYHDNYYGLRDKIVSWGMKQCELIGKKEQILKDNQ